MRHIAPILVLVAFGMVSMAMPKDKPKLSRDLIQMIEKAKPGQSGEVIVQFEEGPGDAERRKVEALGGNQIRVFASIRSGVYSMPLANVKKLAEDTAVVRIAPNRHVSAQKPGPSGSVLIDGDKD